MRKRLSQIPLSLIVVLCLTYGLAPFAPPHIWEKLNNSYTLVFKELDTLIISHVIFR